MPEEKNSSRETSRRKRRPSRHSHLDVCIPHDLNAALDAHIAARRHLGATRTSVTEEALWAFLKPEDPYSSLFRSLNGLENRLATMSTRIDMLGQSFFHFLRYWFILWPDIPQDHLKQNVVQARGMLAKYVGSLRRRLDKKDLWDILDPAALDDVIAELKQTVTEILTDGQPDEEDAL